MSNSSLQQQQHSKWKITVSFSLFALLAFVGEWKHFHFLYGITFSFTSIISLLALRIYGYWPGLMLSAIAITFGSFLFHHPVFHYIFLLEAAVVGLLLLRQRNRFISSDIVFWLLIGIPVIYWIFFLNSSLDPKDKLLIASLVAMNGVFNAFIAELVEQYVPLGTWSRWRTGLRRPNSIRQVLLHFTIGIVFISSLLNIFMNSLSSFKEVSFYAERLSTTEENRITDALSMWSGLQSYEGAQEKIAFLQEVLGHNPARLTTNISDRSGIILASSQEDAVGQSLNHKKVNIITKINDKAYLTVPREHRHSLQLQTWHDGYFVYGNQLADSELMICVEVPLNSYQNYLFTKYFTHLVYLAGFSLIAVVLVWVINRSLARSLTRLAASTTNLPIKLKQGNTVDWPVSSIVEVHSLIANFKHMSSNLIYMFEETKKNNEQLEEQARMLQQSEERLQQLAYYDLLTGLPNRLQFTKQAEEMIAGHLAANKPLAIMFADINRFKQINDTLGHTVGDTLLQKAAERFSFAAARDSSVFRLGGDEFVFVVRGDHAAFEAAAQSIVDSFNEPYLLDGASLFLTVSVGISVFPADGQDLGTLVRNADIAMYSAKEQGDGCYRFFKPALVSDMTEKMQLENGLYNALKQNQFSLNYQPKINAATGELCGIEALIRWRHPELGMIPPDKFIPLAEQSGFILDIDSWVFREACRQNKAWQDAGLQSVCVSVNISARHFYQGHLAEMIEKALSDTGLEPRFVSLEITEGVFMRNMEQVIETILYLRGLGIQISIDDFGTGYSSLNQLQRLPISDVKLDRSFIQGITNDDKKSSIVKAIIELVHSMNMKVVAEGVETEAESKFCTELQCDELQGYLFSRPLPPEQLALMLGKAGHA